MILSLKFVFNISDSLLKILPCLPIEMLYQQRNQYHMKNQNLLNNNQYDIRRH